MPDLLASELLQPRLLDGLTMLLAGSAAGSRPDGATGEDVAVAVRRACVALGADVRLCPMPRDGSGQAAAEEDVERAIDRALEPGKAVGMLTVDCAGLFGGDDHGDGSRAEMVRDARAALMACLEDTWNVTRALANRSLLSRQGARILYIAPAPSAGAHADAARAGLENLVRTLSIEWARHRVTTVAIAPGDGVSADELAALSAYLASPAGAYFSGCLLDLRGPVAVEARGVVAPQAAAV